MKAHDLSIIPLFKNLPEPTIEAICQRCFVEIVAPQQILLLEGDPADTCYFIQEGVLRISRANPEGRVQVLARLTAGAPVNVISLLLHPRLNQATVEALSSTTLIALTADAFDQILNHHPLFAQRLLRLFANRIAHLTDLAAGLSLNSVSVRLARFLIELADSEQTAGGWTQDEIAAQIGTVREIVSRLLREFEQKGLITRNRQQIVLQDRAGLFQEAKLEP